MPLVSDDAPGAPEQLSERTRVHNALPPNAPPGTGQLRWEQRTQFCTIEPFNHSASSTVVAQGDL